MLANLGFIITNWLTSELDHFNLSYSVHFHNVASNGHESIMQFKKYIRSK